MKYDLRTERERQAQHDLMAEIRILAEREGVDAGVLDVEQVRDFRTRALLETEAILALIRSVNAQYQTKQSPRRKAA